MRLTPEVADAALIGWADLRSRGVDLPDAPHDDWCCAKGCPGEGFCEAGARGDCDRSCKCSARDLMIYFTLGYTFGYYRAGLRA